MAVQLKLQSFGCTQAVKDIAQNAGMGQFPICKLKWDLLRTWVTAFTIDKDTFSAPFGIFYVRIEI